MQLPCSPNHVWVRKKCYTHIKFTRNLSPKNEEEATTPGTVQSSTQSFVQNLGKRPQSNTGTYCYTLNMMKQQQQKATLVPFIHKAHKPKRIEARSLGIHFGGNKSRKEKFAKQKILGAYTPFFHVYQIAELWLYILREIN